MYDPAYLCTKKKSALIVVDMQNDFVDDEGAFALADFDVARYQSLEGTITKVICVARGKQIPIIFLKMEHSEENDGKGAWVERRRAMNHPNSCRERTWGAEFYGSLQPEANDHIISKHRYSGFVNTGLHELLMELEVETLVITGINTNTCVESTARDAHHLDYHVVVVEDATACAFEDAYLPSLTNIKRHFGVVIKSDEWFRYV